MRGVYVIKGSNCWAAVVMKKMRKRYERVRLHEDDMLVDFNSRSLNCLGSKECFKKSVCASRHPWIFP